MAFRSSEDGGLLSNAAKTQEPAEESPREATHETQKPTQATGARTDGRQDANEYIQGAERRLGHTMAEGDRAADPEKKGGLSESC